MICSHITIVEKRVGAFGDCAICRLPVIWDGSSWVVRWSLSPHKITKLRRIGIVDRLIEKQGDL